jgi:hypothetical protein
MASTQTKPVSDEQKVMVIAAALAVGASRDDTAEQLAKPLELSALAIAIALLLAQSKPTTLPESPLDPQGSAGAAAAHLEPYFRATYVLNAARRIERGLNKGQSRAELLRKERTFFQQHLDATAKRAAAARLVDAMASRYGNKLGWYATRDSRTTAECRAAHGKNFNPTVRPPIGYPGGVHRFCRCKPGPPFATSETVYSVTPDKAA